MVYFDLARGSLFLLRFSPMASTVPTHEFLDPPTQDGDLGVLGHYRVTDELGRGGMGFVFRGQDVKLNRAVALKVMNQKIAATPNSRKRFIDEARAMAAVHHDNVVTIFEVGESKGTPFMAMEMLKGKTLEALNGSKERLGFEQIIDYARQIAKGLAAAHHQGIVHRDIKPANIWIEAGTGRIKILDFGLALASTPVDHLAGRGAVIGTPGYLSPEQARSEPLDDRSDLYSLGVVLYELCTGQLPILAKSVPGQLISILAHRPTPIQKLNPEIPKPLCDLIQKLLRKEPRSRYSSADVLCSELDRVEKEAHAKSEVAQAINKLQMGLNEVVKKKPSEESVFESVDEPVLADPLANIADPFASIPTASPAATVPVASPTLGTASAPSAVRPAPATRKPAPPQTGSDWKAYWPFAAIIAVVLIALPVLTYAFSGRGRGNTAYIIASGDDSIASNNGVDPNEPDESDVAEETEREESDSGGTVNSNSGQPNATGQDRKRVNQGNRPNTSTKVQSEANSESQPGQPPPFAPSPDSARNQTSTASTESQNPTSQTPGGRNNNRPSPQDMASVGPRGIASNANPTTRPEVAPVEPPTNQVEMKWTSISTNIGRGADAMVQNGTNQKFGLKPSIGVRQRGEVESNHSYIRFDFANIENLQQHIEDAELILSVVGKDRPVGATLNLYGLSVGDWPEEDLDWKRSFSAEGLDSLPLLATVEVTEEIDPRDTQRNVIRIRTPELAGFMAKADRDIVTLALSGSAGDSSFLRFVSREQSVTRAPTLRVHTPAVAPPEEDGQRRGRNRR